MKYETYASFLFHFGLNKITSSKYLYDDILDFYPKYNDVDIQALYEIISQFDSIIYRSTENSYKSLNDIFNWVRVLNRAGKWKNIYSYDIKSAYPSFVKKYFPERYIDLLIAYDTIEHIKQIVPFDYNRYAKYCLNKTISVRLHDILSDIRKYIMSAISSVMLYIKDPADILNYAFDGFFTTQNINILYKPFIRKTKIDVFIQDNKGRYISKTGDKIIIKGFDKYRPLIYDKIIEENLLNKVPLQKILNIKYLSNIPEKFFIIRNPKLIDETYFLTSTGQIDYSHYIEDFKQRYETFVFLQIKNL